MVRTSAPNSSGGLFVDENAGGGIVGTTTVAADLNNHQEELVNAILGAGLTLSSGNQSQLRQAIVALSHVVGELVLSEFEESPSTYFPALSRAINQDISTAHWPQLVAKLRAVKAKVFGVTDHAATVSGSTITMPDTAASNALLNLLQADAIVSAYLNGGEIANFLGGSDFATSATRRTINVAGTDYWITAINLVARTISVSGTPASGSQTVSVYTYRIAGSTTTARLLRIAGFVGVAAGDAGGEVVGGFRRMDRGQGHVHNVGVTQPETYGSGPNARNTISQIPGATSVVASAGLTTDTTNGTPRTGKTTDPRTAGMYFYTYAGILLAAV